MANKVLLKKSSVTAKVPLVGDLDYGELALNYTDEKLYFKNASNVIKSFNVGAVGTTTNALTIGTGLSGTSFNGSAAVTVAIDSTVATLTGTQTLTNKTLTSPTINSGAVSGTFTGAPTFSDTTASTSSTTGAVKIGGGLGVAGNIYVGSGSKVGFVNASNVSVVYQVYNATAGSLDTVFG